MLIIELMEFQAVQTTISCPKLLESNGAFTGKESDIGKWNLYYKSNPLFLIY